MNVAELHDALGDLPWTIEKKLRVLVEGRVHVVHDVEMEGDVVYIKTEPVVKTPYYCGGGITDAGSLHPAHWSPQGQGKEPKFCVGTPQR